MKPVSPTTVNPLPQPPLSEWKSVLLTFWNPEGSSIHCKTEHVNQSESRVPFRRNFYQYHINTPVRGPRGGGGRDMERYSGLRAGRCPPNPPGNVLRGFALPSDRTVLSFLRPPHPSLDLNFFLAFRDPWLFCKVLETSFDEQ